MKRSPPTGIEHHVYAAAAELERLLAPGPVRAHDLVGARLARDALLLVARDDRDRGGAERLGDLQRRGADAAGGSVHEHALTLPAGARAASARSRPCGS